VRDRALRGVPWAVLSALGPRSLTLVTTLVLARLLAPSTFGLMAMAIVVLTVLRMLGELGLAGALVVRQDLDRRGQGAVLTMMLAGGALATVLALAFAPLAGILLPDSHATSVLAVLAASLLVGGFNSFYDAVLQRELCLGPRLVALGCQAVAQAVVSITLAAFGAGVWSLVAGYLAGIASFGLGAFALAPYRVRPRFDRATARSVLGTGSGFVLQGSAVYGQQNVDYVVVGGVLGTASLGLYSMAYRITAFPSSAIAEPIATVTFPAFAQMRHHGSEIEGAFLSALRTVSLVACPFGVLLSASAEPFTLALLGEEWSGMIGPFAVLGVWAAVRPVHITVGWLLVSLGHARAMGLVSVVLLAALAVALLVAARSGGLTAVALVMLAHVTLTLGLWATLVKRLAGVGLSVQWAAVRTIAAACLLAWLTAWVVAQASGSAGATPALVLSLVAGATAYLTTLRVLEPSVLRDGIRRSAQALGRVDG